ncbi:putative RNA methyltransferase [Marinomonas sp. IMCC 4694]|uniref:putative RNA methyltransferase n=1 Tax=Marinomonas sp. IMCC 4694 TaxID=2605432 RepID=UPI0011E61F35|nr:methyltransferase domain-containing protein [Marinomonas sp. IMCC 4694]TYL47528.1 methyltransferase domain-containing protein [Marinomonas sp. IMCC 4694]
MSTLEHLSCPIEASPLSCGERVLTCEHGHTYDVAKTGYVNLLPVQNKRSKDPGDSKEMVAARQRFLNGQHYYPIVSAIVSSWPQGHLTEGVRILDAGCGEGYYLHEMSKVFSKQNINVQRVGLDISKWAILAASKRDKQASWLVGSNANLPVPAARFDAVLCLFGFPVFDEFSRSLSDKGLLLLVESGANHLIELRRLLYPSIHDYQPTYPDGVPGFELMHKHTETFEFYLPSQVKIQDLLSMTPHIHKASYDGRQAVRQLDSLLLTAEVTLRWYQKN